MTTTIDAETLVRLNDPLLECLIRAERAEVRRAIVETLIVEHARPLIRRILRRYGGAESILRPDEAEDIDATLSLRLLGKLQALASAPEEAVRSFEDYVATLAYNAVNDVLRRRYPERTRLKNRLRYLLTHDERLALWSTNAGMTCGLAAARGTADALVDPPFGAEAAAARIHDPERGAETLVAVLAHARRPMLFDTLVAVVADLWSVRDSPLTGRASNEIHEPPPITRFETREFVRALWREILLLRSRQRKALLLNLRDRDTANVVSLIALTEIATIDEIAAAIEISTPELGALWNDLPLDDLRIAAMMGITRQQVINLRKSARERLANRVFRPRKP